MNISSNRRMERTYKIFGAIVALFLVAGSILIILVDTSTNDGPSNSSETPATDTRVENAFRATAEAHPESAEAAIAYANYLSNTDRIAEAIPWYEKAIANEPDNSQNRLDFAQSLSYGGYREDAELQFTKSIEIAPDDAQAHFYLGELYASWPPPRPDEAIAEYQRTIELAPDSYIAEQAAVRIKELQDSLATPVA
jgi:tetratricopeptide (TPR) repeat protein